MQHGRGGPAGAPSAIKTFPGTRLQDRFPSHCHSWKKSWSCGDAFSPACV